MTLYDITGQFLELLELAQDETIDQKTIDDTMESINCDYADKADGYAMVDYELDSCVKALKTLKKEIDKKIRLAENNRKRIRENLKQSMIATGKRKFSTALFSFRVQNTAPSLDILDETKIPDEFWKPQDPVLDKKALLASVKSNPEAAKEYAILKTSEALIIN